MPGKTVLYKPYMYACRLIYRHNITSLYICHLQHIAKFLLQCSMYIHSHNHSYCRCPLKNWAISSAASWASGTFSVAWKTCHIPYSSTGGWQHTGVVSAD